MPLYRPSKLSGLCSSITSVGGEGGRDGGVDGVSGASNLELPLADVEAVTSGEALTSRVWASKLW